MKRFLIFALCACDPDTNLVPAYSLDALTCSAGKYELSRASPAVMFVLDRSGSMANAFGAGTRWSTLTAALATTLPTVADDVAVGAYVFPTSAALQCSVPVTPVLLPTVGGGASVISMMLATEPGGGTPTADAIALASSAFSGSPMALVLATDGAPNCNSSLNASSCTCPDSRGCSSAVSCLDADRTVTRIASLAASGVATWVIGIASDDSFSGTLNQMAIAGGRPNSGAHSYFSGASASELVDAFSTIQTQLRSCTFTSPTMPDATGSISVTLNGAVITQGDNGWVWGANEIVLRGVACDAAVASGAASVVIEVTCGADAGTSSEAWLN